MPLVISPRWDDSASFLKAWLEINRSWLDAQILQHGAVLLRGFCLDTPLDFEQTTLALQPNLCDAYRGTSPRSVMPGTKYAFTAADAPVNYPIAQHLEMSFLKAPPRHLYFGCMKASEAAGGETALCDFRKVYQDLPEDLRCKLQTKKIRYTRTHKKVGETYTYDVGAMLSWPKLFNTSSTAEVDRICRLEGSPEPQWSGPNQDTFVQQWVDEPFGFHPVTGDIAWFNHAQVFHWTTFPMELWYSFKRVKDFRLFLHFIMISIFFFIKYGILGYQMALQTDFGDGSAISFSEMNIIRACIHKHMVFSRWEKGDVLCIDNFSVSHGRQPTYDKSRKIIVAWSHPHDKTSSRTPEQHAASISGVKKNDDPAEEIAPGLVPASTNSSYDSSLTKTEAQTLKEEYLKHRLEEQMAAAFSH